MSDNCLPTVAGHGTNPNIHCMLVRDHEENEFRVEHVAGLLQSQCQNCSLSSISKIAHPITL